MKIAIAIVLTIIWMIFTDDACHKDKPVVIHYILGLLLAAFWGSIL